MDDAVMRLSRSRRWLAPLTLAMGAFAMLFDGVKLLFANWRLTLVQVLPAMWIWAAMYDLKLHVSPLHDKAFHVYILGRVGLLMLGSKALFPLGVTFFALGLTLEAGATGAVKAVRMSA